MDTSHYNFKNDLARKAALSRLNVAVRRKGYLPIANLTALKKLITSARLKLRKRLCLLKKKTGQGNDLDQMEPSPDVIGDPGAYLVSTLITRKSRSNLANIARFDVHAGGGIIEKIGLLVM